MHRLLWICQCVPLFVAFSRCGPIAALPAQDQPELTAGGPGQYFSKASPSALDGCPDLCRPEPGSPAAFSNSLIPVTEAPPDGFVTDSDYIRNGALLHKMDVFMAAIHALTVLSIADWNSVVLRAKFDETPRVMVKVSGASLQAKHVMWSLYTVCKFMVLNRRYATVRWKTMVGEQLLGVGQVLQSEEAMAMGGTQVNSSAAAALEDNIEDSGVQSTDLTASGPVDALKARRDGIRWHLEWPRRGAEFPSHEVLYSIMKLIIDIAELPTKDPNAGVMYYNADADFQLIICPRSEHVMEDVKNYIVVYALGGLAAGFAEDPKPGGRWQEFRGEFWWYGTKLGKAWMIKGHPIDRCEADPPAFEGSQMDVGDVSERGGSSGVSIARS